MRFAHLLLKSVLFVEIVNTQTEYEDLQHNKEKRAMRNPYKPAFAPSEQIILLKRHNQYRRKQNASNIEMMFWSYTLEKVAQRNADKCIAKPISKMKHHNVFSTVGEKMYAISGGPLDWTSIAFMYEFYRRYEFYNYTTNSCRDKIQCDYYKQKVWHNSHYLGCGVRFCPIGKVKAEYGLVSVENMTLIVCHYAPAGSLKGQRPYKRGKACSECPKGRERCDNGLCRPEKCANTTCEHGGIFMADICYCDCTDTCYVGDQCEVDSHNDLNDGVSFEYSEMEANKRPEKCAYTTCKNGGKFISDICYCDCTDTGYQGDQCEIGSFEYSEMETTKKPYECVYKTCKNGGKFLTEICYCDCRDTGYTGNQCEVRITRPKSEPVKSRSVSVNISGNLLLLTACVLFIVFWSF